MNPLHLLLFLYHCIKIKSQSAEFFTKLMVPRNRYYLYYESSFAESFLKLTKVMPSQLDYNQKKFIFLILGEDNSLKEHVTRINQDNFVLSHIKPTNFLYRSEHIISTYLMFLNKRYRRKRNLFNNYFRKKFKRRYLRKLKKKKKKHQY